MLDGPIMLGQAPNGLRNGDFGVLDNLLIAKEPSEAVS
jgi:hypothetical protein